MSTPSPAGVDEYIKELESVAAAGGYHLNPDRESTIMLAEGLLLNIGRYGYPLCPCRLTGGSRADDQDVICPCDYRDEDLEEFGCCY